MSVQELRDLLAELAGDIPTAPEDPLVGISVRVRRSRRRARAAGSGLAIVVAVAVAATVVLSNRAGTPNERVSTGPPTAGTAVTPVVPAATAAQLAGYHWSSLPPSPLHSGALGAVAWTGDELVEWDGQAASPAIPNLHNAEDHAAAYVPMAGYWRILAPPTGLVARENAVTVWTGREVLVIGGDTGNPAVAANDGAYDPATDQWRVLPPRPGSGAQLVVAAWTGQEAIVVSSNRAVAAYSPTGNRWRTLPAIPEPPERDLMGLIPVWTGTRLLLWTEWSHTVTSGTTTTGDVGIDLWRYAPDGGAWSSAGSPPSTGPDGVDTAVWTGHDVVLPASRPFRGGFSGPMTFNLHGYLYDPVSNMYRPIAHGPVDDGATGAVWTGNALLRISEAEGGPDRLNPGDAAAWVPDTDAWARVPKAPVPVGFDYTVWTGHEVLALGLNGGARLGP